MIENMTSVTEIGFVIIDAVFELEIVLRTVDASTLGPAVKI